MKILAALYRDAIVVLAIITAAIGGYKSHAYFAPYEIRSLPTIVEVQKQIGATADGKLGPETQRLWDEAIWKQNVSKMKRTHLQEIKL